MNPKFHLVGKRFGRLVVIERLPNAKGGRWWKCRCDCGNEIKSTTGYLRGGNTHSCGCSQRDAARRVCIDRSTHQMTGRRIYNIWRGMKARCSNPKNIVWPIYGGRGVRVCDEWLEFWPFWNWAIVNGYQRHLTIDRIDPNGNYEPSNCRWANYFQQARNRRSSYTPLTINEVTMSVAEWSAKTGVGRSTIRYRMSRGITGESLFAPTSR